MKVLVRCVRTKLYFKKSCCWTENKQEAHDFQTTVHVIDEAKLHGGNEDLEIVFSFGEARFDVVIPIELGGPKCVRLATAWKNATDTIQGEAPRGPISPLIPLPSADRESISKVSS